MATNYQRGRAFEYRVRDRLYKNGAVYVMRAAQSKGIADQIALWPVDGSPVMAAIPPPWLVQCKTGSARMSPADRKALLVIATRCGGCAVLAQPGPKGRGVEFNHLTEEV